jgi:hypothetical protein
MRLTTQQTATRKALMTTLTRQERLELLIRAKRNEETLQSYVTRILRDHLSRREEQGT